MRTYILSSAIRSAKWRRLLAITGVAAALASPVSAQERASRVYQTAFDAYIFGYAMMVSDITCKVRTAVPAYDPPTARAPFNQPAMFRVLLDASFTDVKRANVDTLYSSACLDVSKEPVVISHPDMGDRLFMLPLLDLSTDVFAAPGTRTTGNKAASYAIVGPRWTGKMPGNVMRIDAPTSIVALLGRISISDKNEVAAVNALQDKISIVPLSRFGKPYSHPPKVAVDATIDAKTPPPDQVAAMDGVTYFGKLAELLKANPPHANDSPIMQRLEALGFKRGKSFEAKKLSQADVAEINRAAKDAQTYIERQYTTEWARTVNGWQVLTEGGTYGTHYLLRALVAYGLWGYNVPEDAIYPNTRVDGDRQLLNGAKRYVIRMSKDQIPPVNATGFWSLTMYTKDGFFVANPLGRAALRGERVKSNADGSVDLYIQAEPPGADKESNWLPAPKNADFEVQFRLYHPKREALDGRWAPVPVKAVTQ